MGKKSYIHLSTQEFEKRCEAHNKNNKKLKALFNFSEYRKEKCLFLLKAANEEYKKGFLDEDDELYLEKKLSKFAINPNDWCYKTKWVKNKIKQRKKIIPKQLSFNFGGKKYDIPHKQ